MLKNTFFYSNMFLMFYVLKTDFDCFNSQVNNLEDMEGE